jgi:F-type H+-transporting ATPase subunit b
VEQLKTEVITLSMAAAGKIISKNIDAKENEQLIGDFISQLDKEKIGDLSC